ncbi:hypothetical protein M3Y96_00703900 [Aphelenchoides besseyi]|nr:hypothetical protein M3Y96_00703900 [Aphelenchoides besseyi]
MRAMITRVPDVLFGTKGFDHVHERVFKGCLTIMVLLLAVLISSFISFGPTFLGILTFSVNVVLVGSVLYGNVKKNRYWYWPAIVVGRVYVMLTMLFVGILLTYSFLLQYDVLERYGEEASSLYNLKYDDVTRTVLSNDHPRVINRRINQLAFSVLLAFTLIPVYILHSSISTLELGYTYLKQLKNSIQSPSICSPETNHTDDPIAFVEK